MNKSNSIAISWVISRTFIMACIMLIGRVLGVEGMNGFAIIFWQNIFAFIFVAIYICKKREIPKTAKLNLHILRCVLGITSGSILFYALPLMRLNVATALTFAGPIFSTIAAMIFLGERTGPRRIAALIMGFVGILIILRPGTELFNPNALLLIGVAVIWAFTDVTIKVLMRTETTDAVLFYMVIIMLVISIPIGIFFWHEPSLKELLLCAALGLFHLGNFTTISKALKHADISVVMPFEFFRLVFASIFAVLIFDEVIRITTIAGSLVILGSSVYVAHRLRVEHRNESKK